MRRTPILTGLLALLLTQLAALPLAGAAFAQPVLHVHGQNNEVIDRPAVQAALDTMPAGGTLYLHGVFQLDGQRLIMRQPHDVVGLDGAELRGLLDANGEPVIAPATATLFNRGLSIEGLNGAHWSGVTIEDVTFTGFRVALQAAPQLTFTGPSTAFCADQFVTPATLSGLTVRNNHFENSALALQLTGDVRGAEVVGNTFDGVRTGLRSVGGPEWPFNCTNPDNSAGTIEISSPSDLSIRDNVATADDGSVPSFWGLVLLGNTGGVEVRGNSLTNFVFGITTWLTGDGGGPLRDNLVLGADWGIWLISGTDWSVRHNTLDAWGAGVDLWMASGSTVHDNVFLNLEPVFADIWLEQDSCGNQVIAGRYLPDVLDDSGCSNRLVGKFNVLNSPSVPLDVRQTLKDRWKSDGVM